MNGCFVESDYKVKVTNLMTLSLASTPAVIFNWYCSNLHTFPFITVSLLSDG